MKALLATLSTNDIQHKLVSKTALSIKCEYDECYYAEVMICFCYSECRGDVIKILKMSACSNDKATAASQAV